ncbi:hypothetical protein HMPREF3192_01187 [Atopobium deltae]|uniref:Uncharacterized protein n=1 Tax=Atopobium deltae TaxID=1393034 RepID=A0A133XR50_9ACTN|nr:hypothetical protein HMPREF3192_01187 [Atopobium deltae]
MLTYSAGGFKSLAERFTNINLFAKYMMSIEYQPVQLFVCTPKCTAIDKIKIEFLP